eukprot:2905787-Amphidinium_carterae.1
MQALQKLKSQHLCCMTPSPELKFFFCPSRECLPVLLFNGGWNASFLSKKTCEQTNHVEQLA